MSAPAFTPGPWRVEDKGTSFNIVAGPDYFTRVFVAFAGAGEVPSKANARLIAAAPTAADYIRRKAENGDEEAQQIWEMICGRG